MYPLSLPEAGAGGAGFRPAGRLAGGAGGVGLPLIPFAIPFATDFEPGGAGGAERACTGGAGGGAALGVYSSRYAEGTQPDAELSNLFPNHHPV